MVALGTFVRQQYVLDHMSELSLVEGSGSEASVGEVEGPLDPRLVRARITTIK